MGHYEKDLTEQEYQEEYDAAVALTFGEQGGKKVYCVLDSLDGIVEIGCVEMINRQLTGRIFHAYIKPLDQRGQVLEMEQEVIDIHGLTNEFLNDKPIFSQVVRM